MRKAEIRFLKLFVYLLGLVLMGCTIFLIYVVYKKNFALDTHYIKETTSSCTNFSISVQGKLLEVGSESENLKVLYKDMDGHYKLAIYNYCNGNLINEVLIKQVKEPANTHTPSTGLELQNEDVLS